MEVKKFNPEVLYTNEPITKVNRDDIEYLKEKSQENLRKRIRLCAHQGVDDTLHEMLIIHTNETYVRPHKHFNKSESFHIIEGACDVVIFDEEGTVSEVIPMGTFDSGKRFYYRLPEPYYHTLLIHSEFLVFHETTNGPFNRSETEFASWSPTEEDTAGVQKFFEDLHSQLNSTKV
ncbi:WbuC family cupin fold metalloprotein [Lusitaniella coriacea LEGE 07157]|uniref:WbuC family cupin fold metalloprotein n=1 Tax=Lusitaniella coriacea LEGE 07157 TaxID=945747 RepID=A0A8J7DX19_9CYAN|nr:WbuC family cupin fold metalloprotein [Lusitaniella coriacea]MBE9116857.1 WbuC family cupin fold metalloprotein [Lusitaniella coriacea LEGE 07157]